MPQFSRARFKRSIKSWSSVAKVELDVAVGRACDNLDRCTIDRYAGDEDALALACVREAIKKMSAYPVKLGEE